MSVLDTSKKVFYYFEEITKIPHGSYNEKAICDYVENFAKERGLKYFRDEMHNIIVYKDATPGYEDHAPVMLQGHLDMVNEKNNDSDHDFDKDPLNLYIEDGWLHARGTTLGADDGVAVAYMLSVLDDDTAAHPALDCVFTVQEEVGLFGAGNIKAENIRARRMIGMDSGGEVVTAVSASGGRRTIVSKEITMEANDWPGYQLDITGLLGGHSGGCIAMERGNSNKLALRILHDLQIRGVNIRLIHLHGGLKENAIPRECTIQFASDCPQEELTAKIAESKEKIAGELEFSDAGFAVSLKGLENADQAMPLSLSSDIIRMIYLLPNGFKARSMKIEGLTTVSLNLGVLRTEEGKVTCFFSIRSPMKSAIEQLSDEIDEIASIFGASTKHAADYPGWNYEEVSPMRELMKGVIKDCFGKELQEHAGHGGLETGVFKGEMPDLDIVTFGPISKGAHTPDECLNLASFEKCYGVLLEFLKRL